MFAPLADSSFAMAAPIPVEDPEIMAVFPASECRGSSIFILELEQEQPGAGDRRPGFDREGEGVQIRYRGKAVC